MTARGPNPTAASAGSTAVPAPLPDVLDAAWRDFFARTRDTPAHPEAQDFLHRDLKESFARMIPADAAVFEAGCGEGELLAALPQARRMGIDYLPEMIERAPGAPPRHQLRGRRHHRRGAAAHRVDRVRDLGRGDL